MKNRMILAILAMLAWVSGVQAAVEERVVIPLYRSAAQVPGLWSATAADLASRGAIDSDRQLVIDRLLDLNCAKNSAFTKLCEKRGAMNNYLREGTPAFTGQDRLPEQLFVTLAAAGKVNLSIPLSVALATGVAESKSAPGGAATAPADAGASAAGNGVGATPAPAAAPAASTTEDPREARLREMTADLQKSVDAIRGEKADFAKQQKDLLEQLRTAKNAAAAAGKNAAEAELKKLEGVVKGASQATSDIRKLEEQVQSTLRGLDETIAAKARPVAQAAAELAVEQKTAVWTEQIKGIKQYTWGLGLLAFLALALGGYAVWRVFRTKPATISPETVAKEVRAQLPAVVDGKVEEAVRKALSTEQENFRSDMQHATGAAKRAETSLTEGLKAVGELRTLATTAVETANSAKDLATAAAGQVKRLTADAVATPGHLEFPPDFEEITANLSDEHPQCSFVVGITPEDGPKIWYEIQVNYFLREGVAWCTYTGILGDKKNECLLSNLRGVILRARKGGNPHRFTTLIEKEQSVGPNGSGHGGVDQSDLQQVTAAANVHAAGLLSSRNGHIGLALGLPRDTALPPGAGRLPGTSVLASSKLGSAK